MRSDGRTICKHKDSSSFWQAQITVDNYLMTGYNEWQALQKSQMSILDRIMLEVVGDGTKSKENGR